MSLEHLLLLIGGFVLLLIVIDVAVKLWAEW